MKYRELEIGGELKYQADPMTWEELAYTISEEDPIMDFNPTSPPDYSHLLNLL